MKCNEQEQRKTLEKKIRRPLGGHQAVKAPFQCCYLFQVVYSCKFVNLDLFPFLHSFKLLNGDSVAPPKGPKYHQLVGDRKFLTHRGSRLCCGI